MQNVECKTYNLSCFALDSDLFAHSETLQNSAIGSEHDKIYDP